MPTQTRYYTPEEYLAIEEKAEYKNEYRDGEIVAIIGENTNHNEITGNLAAHLKFALRSKNYRIYIENVRLWIPRYRQYTYPDVMIIQGEPIYAEKGTATVMNPILIAEVLSPSTQNYDQGDKFMYYRSIPEMKEYILIDQKQFHVMQHTKTSENQWLLTEYEHEDAIITLNSVNFTISLTELYTGVSFENTD